MDRQDKGIINSVAIVTGAGMGIGGIGREIARKLATDGAVVMLADIDPAVEKSCEEIRQSGPEIRCDWIAVDLSTQDGVKAMVEKTIDSFDRIDILVNGAGSGVIRPFLDHDAESLQATVNRNLWTALWCCREILPFMTRQNFGRIVNIGADSLRTGIPGHAGYNAAKAGVVGLTVGLATEFAKYDITINTVSPCVVNTARFQSLLSTDPALAEEFLRVVPKGRGANISEIVDLVAFLARRETAFITGQDISVNGGSAMP